MEIRFSAITATSFQATWDSQKGATSYNISVSTGGTLFGGKHHQIFAV